MRYHRSQRKPTDRSRTGPEAAGRQDRGAATQVNWLRRSLPVAFRGSDATNATSLGQSGARVVRRHAPARHRLSARHPARCLQTLAEDRVVDDSGLGDRDVFEKKLRPPRERRFHRR